MSQQICLKWNDHTSIINDFQTYLSTEALADVTLTCDGKKLKAHKLVLSAGSVLFQSLFMENPCKHPVIILQGIGYAELKTVIDFMYRGEVTISEDKLAAVIKCAETLRVKILGDVMTDNDESVNQSDKAPVDQSGAVSPNHTSESDQSENLPEDLLPTAMTATTSYKEVSAEMHKNSDETSDAEHIMPDPYLQELPDDMESNASDASTSTIPFLPYNTSSLSRPQQKSVPIKENFVDALTMPILCNSMDSSKSLEEQRVEESIVEASTIPLHSINSPCIFQEEQPVKENMREAIVVIEDFENIPISMVERLLTSDPEEQQNSPDQLRKQNSRSQSHSRKRHQSSSDRLKKQNSRSRSNSKKQYENSPDHLRKQNSRSRSHSKKRSQSSSPDDVKKQNSRGRSRSKKRHQSSPDHLKKQNSRGRSRSKKRLQTSSGYLKKQNQKGPNCSKERYQSSPGHPKKQKQKSPGLSKECDQSSVDPLNRQNQKNPGCSKEQHHSSLDYSEEPYHSSTDDFNEKEYQNSNLDHSEELHQSSGLNPLIEQYQSSSIAHSMEQQQSNSLDYSKEQYSSHSSNKRQQPNLNHSKKAKYENSSNYFKDRHRHSSNYLVKYYQTSSDEEQNLSNSDDSCVELYQSNSDQSYMELHQSNSDDSDKEQPENSLDHSDKEQCPSSSYRSSSLPPLKPTPTLPIVLCEMMPMTDYQYPKTFSASPSKDLEKEEEVKKMKKRPSIKIDSAARKVLYKIENTPSGARVYTCRKCSFKTSCSVNLKRHVIAKHEKMKCFKCDQCSFAATLQQNLKRHIAEVHQNALRFQCNLCSYQCAQKSHLIGHMERVHEGKKPFMCEACGFRSSSKASVKKHIIAVHEKKRDYLCEFCTYRCAAKENLKRHVRLMHEQKEPSQTLSDD